MELGAIASLDASLAAACGNEPVFAADSDLEVELDVGSALNAMLGLPERGVGPLSHKRSQKVAPGSLAFSQPVRRPLQECTACPHVSRRGLPQLVTSWALLSTQCTALAALANSFIISASFCKVTGPSRFSGRLTHLCRCARCAGGGAFLWREQLPRIFVGDAGSLTCAHVDLMPQLELAHGLTGTKILGVATRDATARLLATHGAARDDVSERELERDQERGRDEQGAAARGLQAEPSTRHLRDGEDVHDDDDVFDDDEGDDDDYDDDDDDDCEAARVPTNRELEPLQESLLGDDDMSMVALRRGDLLCFSSAAMHFASNGADGLNAAMCALRRCAAHMSDHEGVTRSLQEPWHMRSSAVAPDATVRIHSADWL
eukprot:2801447-Pleurochrysis_carterae.AAC.3